MPEFPEENPPPMMSGVQRLVFLIALATTSYAVVRLFEIVFAS